LSSDFLRAPLRALPAESGCVIDCDTCTVRGDACADCVVSVMLGGPPDVVAEEERRALGVLAGAGLVPPLQMTAPPEAPGPPEVPGPPEAPGSPEPPGPPEAPGPPEPAGPPEVPAPPETPPGDPAVTPGEGTR
jgi:hypothetical protein